MFTGFTQKELSGTSQARQDAGGRNDGLTLPLSNKVELHFCREGMGVS